MKNLKDRTKKIRYNPIEGFVCTTVIAGRIADQLPSEDTFAAFKMSIFPTNKDKNKRQKKC